MFAKFHNTLQDSSYESRKKEKKKREKNYQQNLQSIIQTWPRVAIDIRSLVTKTMHISQLLRCPHCHLQQSCRQGTRGSEDERIGRVNRLSSLGNGRYRSIMPFWSNDRGLVSTRSRTDTSRVDGSSTGNRFLLTGICVSGPALFHISKVVVSLSLSLSTRSLSSLPILARVCSHHCQSKDANERDPSSSNNLFPSWSSRNPRHTISYVPWWIPSLLASCESRGIEARTRLSDPDGQVVGPTTSRSRPGRGPTVASGPQQHLWSGLLRGPIWDSSPRSSCNNVDTDPSSFSSFSFSPLFLGLFAPGPRQRILEFKLDASGPNRPDSDTPLILKSSFLPLYGSDLWLSTGIPLQGKLISVQLFFFYVTFVIRRTSGLLDRLQMRSLVLDNENRECRIVSEVWWKRVILRPWPRSSIPMDARTELRRLSTIKLLQLA